MLKDIGDFTLLTALPLKQKIESFCKNDNELNEVMNTLSKNKEKWIKENIGDCKYIIVNKRSEKLKMCTSPNDILIDDSKTTCTSWRKEGGKAFNSVQEYLDSNIKLVEENKVIKENLW